MIYPVLYLNNTEKINNIALIDTEFDDNPFLNLSFFREDCPEIFDDGWEDCVEEYDIEEDEYGDIDYR